MKFFSTHNDVGNGHFGIEIFSRLFIGVYYYGWPNLYQVDLSILKVVRSAPTKEHITDGKPCWCRPRAIREGESIVWVHNKPAPSSEEK